MPQTGKRIRFQPLEFYGKLESGQTSSLGKDHGILQLIQLEISFWWHQYTNDIVIFKRNKSTGALTDSGKE
jgi:6-phosphogluconolactonase